MAKTIHGYRTFEDWQSHFKKVHPGVEPIKIPCGRCLACQINKANDWSNRIMLEKEDHEYSYFITLTYDNDHLVDYDGEPLQSPALPSLYKKHLQDFFKRLRSKLDYANADKIRYFACGEYGTDSNRPHYHAIVFGLRLDDLKVYKRSVKGDIYYNSDFINNCWGHGFSVVAEVTPESAAYVSRYCTKKLGVVDRDVYEKYKLCPEFITMSRRPGIARNAYEKTPFDPSVRYNISTRTGGKSFTAPRYFKRLYDSDCPDLSYVDKLNNKHDAAVSEHFENQLYDGHEIDHLQAIEEDIENRLKVLRRNEV